MVLEVINSSYAAGNKGIIGRDKNIFEITNLTRPGGKTRILNTYITLILRGLVRLFKNASNVRIIVNSY